jgi:hypothetical protein
MGERLVVEFRNLVWTSDCGYLVLAAVAEAEMKQENVDSNASSRFGFHWRSRQLTAFTCMAWKLLREYDKPLD